MTIIDLDAHRPHEVFEAICVTCAARWYACVPVGVALKDLDCPNGHTGAVIRTGQPLEDVSDGTTDESAA